jgi:hypothetical protein
MSESAPTLQSNKKPRLSSGETLAKPVASDLSAVTDTQVIEFERISAINTFPVWPALFIVAICLPFIFWFGAFRMSPYRVVLMLTFIPAIVAWLSGKSGKPTSIDYCFLFSSLWAALALFISADFFEIYQTAIIFFVETFGSYLLARVYVANYNQFLKFVKFLAGTLLLLFPFAMIETLGHTNLILLALNKLGHSYYIVDIGARMGLYRSQVVFEHPILWGVFASSMFGIIVYTLGSGRGLALRGFYTIVAFAATISSVSSGALVSLAVQIILMTWDKVTQGIKNRWRILSAIAIAMYVTVDLLSNRTPFQVFITYLTFSAQSSYNRVNIWTFGTAEVWRHPFFGIGMGDWERPRFMSASMDNFWLVTAVRYGLPSLILLSCGIIGLMRRMGKAKLLSTAMESGRLGLMTTYVGLIFSGCTVHYWNSMYCWVMFLFGLGHWCLAYPQLGKSEATTAATENLKRQVPVRTNPQKLRPSPRKATVRETGLSKEKKWLQ